jgi:predicted NAD/FAD-dependent oxidoreductase
MGEEVIIVGAGLAGLTCARRLEQSGRSALIVEASDDIGGRVRTDEVDGFLLDRGFQVFLEAYPQAQHFLDYDSLDLKSWKRGALIWTGHKFEYFGDPRHNPAGGLKSALADIGGFSDKARLVKLWTRLEILGGAGVSDERKPQSTLEALREFGFHDGIIDRFLRPLFGGAMVDPDLDSSSMLFDFIFEMFSEGQTSLPSGGMQSIPRQIASQLTDTEIRLESPVGRVRPGMVELEDGERIEADVVVIATDGPGACELLDTLETCEMRPSTTVYFTAPEPPLDDRLLILNGSGQGPINSLSIITNVVPEYGDGRRALISGSILGERDDDQLIAECRSQLSAWFDDIADWEHLRTYVIAKSLPAQTPDVMPPLHKDVFVEEGLYVCGDHRDTASINGAMLSGRRVAEAILEETRRIDVGRPQDDTTRRGPPRPRA